MPLDYRFRKDSGAGPAPAVSGRRRRANESPWFPGLRIYRQKPDGEWGAALARLEQDLLAKYGARKQ